MRLRCPLYGAQVFLIGHSVTVCRNGSFGEDGLSWLASPSDAMLPFAAREEAFREEVMFAVSRMDIPLFQITDQEESPDGIATS